MMVLLIQTSKPVHTDACTISSIAPNQHTLRLRVGPDKSHSTHVYLEIWKQFLATTKSNPIIYDLQCEASAF
uniref:Uncharacterized protein n=1 Tax=Arundo donax TaxID=35708 RepID=A0A0A9C1A8_ARUDO